MGKEISRRETHTARWKYIRFTHDIEVNLQKQRGSQTGLYSQDSSSQERGNRPACNGAVGRSEWADTLKCFHMWKTRHRQDRNYEIHWRTAVKKDKGDQFQLQTDGIEQFLRRAFL